MSADEDPADLMKKCIENGRVDVLRSMLAEIVTKPNFNAIVDSIEGTSQGTLLHFAASRGDHDSVRALLSAGVNPCLHNSDGKTPLQISKSDAVKNAFLQELLQAVAQSKLGRVCQLLSAGVGIDSTDSEHTGNTPLHYAASFGTPDVVKVLCEGGADVNKQNIKRETPLHDAVTRGSPEIVKQLLGYGSDPSIENEQGLDALKLAQNKPDILQTLSVHTVTETVRKEGSVESLDEVSSIITEASTRMNFRMLPDGSGSPGRPDRFILAQDYKIEEWNEYLWPQPKRIAFSRIQDGPTSPMNGTINGTHEEKTGNGAGDMVNGKSPIQENNNTGENAFFQLPPDRRLRIYFFKGEDSESIRRIMQIWNLYSPLLLGSHKIGIDFQYYRSPLGLMDESGNSTSTVSEVRCGLVPSIFEKKESYSLTIKTTGIEIVGSDLTGLKHGISTLVQVIRAQPISDQGPLSIPSLTIRDSPDTKYRAVFVDFTGCRIFAMDTLCSIASRFAFCKANQLIVHFEVRTTDKFSLPYSSKDLFHLKQVCEDIHVTLIPSLDLNSRHVESSVVHDIVYKFLEEFIGVQSFHFGENLTHLLLQDLSLLEMIHSRGGKPLINLSFDKLTDLPTVDRPIPPYCILCIPGMCLLKESVQEEIVRGNHGGGLMLKFTTSDIGYLCQAPETMVKNAILAAKLGTRCPVIGTMVCDMSTGCEMMPQSLAYLPEIAVLGVSWNRDTDMRKFCFLLPQIGAEQILLDRKMAALFQQILVLGYVEHELTKLGLGLGLMGQKNGAGLVNSRRSSTKEKDTLSVIVQLLLNPDSMTLERLTPVAFKKARIELTKSLQCLNEVKKTLPYSYDLALTLAEIQLITDLMILAAKMGQALCIHGSNPQSEVGYSVVNVGVANLPFTTRTDLANLLLEIRSRFQHTWLSRNLPSTLPNAVKIFDNLFRALLPPSMQEYGDNLL